MIPRRRPILLIIHLVIAVSAAPIAGRTLIKGATIYTGDGSRRVGDLLIGADGRVAPEANAAKQRIDGTRVIEAGGKILTPGFIDCSTGLGLVEVSYLPAGREDSAGPETVRAAFQVSDVFDPSSPVIPVARAGGITSALAVPTGGLVAGQSAWIDLAGSRSGDHATLVHRGIALHASLARGDKRSTRGARFLSLRRLFDDLNRFRVERFAAVADRQPPVSRLDFLALERYQANRRPVVFRVNRAAHIRSVLELSRANKLRPIIYGGAEAWRVADLLARHEVPVALNPIANLPRDFDTRSARADAAAILSRAGVAVLFSSFDTHRVGKLRQLAGNAVRAGMPYQAALRAVSLEPARAFGMAADYGSLRPGRLANAVLWSGDPFEPSSRVVAMWIRGRPVSLESRQTELLRRYRRL